MIRSKPSSVSLLFNSYSKDSKLLVATKLLMPLLNNCGPHSAIIGPSLTLINTGSILQASMDQFDYDRGENKQLIYNKFVNFITKYKNGDTVKGMYLWGKYSVGKTYCLSALANELMKNSVDVIIAYYPDLVREFKSRISTNTLEEVVSKLKQIDVLMLDDIGAENNSPWVRDEILGPIIQFRLLDEKPTFFSSNLSYKDLSESHFSNTKTKVGTIRGYRIGVRIKDLVGEDNIIKM